MQDDIWTTTYRNDSCGPDRAISILTAIHPTTGRFDGRKDWGLCADLAIEHKTQTESGSVRTCATATLSAADLRHLAALLTEHADRIEADLQPQLDERRAEMQRAADERAEREKCAAEFAALYREPESA